MAKACINLDFPSLPTRKAIVAAVAPYGLKVESFIARGPAGGPNADIVGDDRRIRAFLVGFSADIAADAARIVSNEFSYEPWRHGGWYVNLRYPSGACGCVSRNYADGKWRIACDPRPFEKQPTFPNRDAAARGERDLIAAIVNVTAGERRRLKYPPHFKTLPEYTAHAGQAVDVIRPLDASEADAEVGPMFKVRAADGWEGDAFAAELEPIYQ